jgi:hypothetical protein
VSGYAALSMCRDSSRASHHQETILAISSCLGVRGSGILTQDLESVPNGTKDGPRGFQKSEKRSPSVGLLF